MVKIKFEKRELLFVLIGIITIMIWFLLIKDNIAPYLEKLPIFLAAIIFHFGFYIGILFISSILTTTKLKIKFNFIAILSLIALDIIDAPYILNKQGIINKSVEFWFTTYGALFASIYSLFSGGYLLWFLTYIITPSILAIIIIAISFPKQIAKIFK